MWLIGRLFFFVEFLKQLIHVNHANLKLHNVNEVNA